MKGKDNRGGYRPGAGRPSIPDAKKVKQVTITITARQYDDFLSLRERKVDVNRAVGKEITRLAIAHDLADVGID